MAEKLKLNGGVFIIGSLLWQDHQGDNPTLRKDWRRERLKTRSRIPVKVPIRYGRKSSKGEYTMVVATATDPGTGWVASFRNPIQEKIDLKTEALRLAEAEGMRNRLIVSWSVVGILYNTAKISAEVHAILSEWWNDIIRADRGYAGFLPNRFRLGTEAPPVNMNGELTIPWVVPVDDKYAKRLDSFDFLLATVTEPTEYPSMPDMAANVLNDKVRKYFRKNRRHRITTFQDESILKELELLKKKKK